jgi:hypothetical protein
MTPTSLLPKIARAAGLSFQALCERMLATAVLDDVSVRPGVEAPAAAAPALRVVAAAG